MLRRPATLAENYGEGASLLKTPCLCALQLPSKLLIIMRMIIHDTLLPPISTFNALKRKNSRPWVYSYLYNSVSLSYYVLGNLSDDFQRCKVQAEI